AVRALSPTPRLAHVVRGDVVAHVPRVVRADDHEAARGRSSAAAPAPSRSIRRRAPPLRPCAAVPLPVHDAGRAPRDGSVVAPRAHRGLPTAGDAAEARAVLAAP